MRFMMIVKSNNESEAGKMPSEQELAEMGRYNEELVKAGVMLDGTGLHPTSKGFKVRYDGATKRQVVDGPFTEAKEHIAGYWVIQVKSREEAIEWAKRVPFQEGELEVRQLFELDDFVQGPAIEQHKELEKKLAAQKASQPS
jgi:hypothetical protein